jgi:hypothetical protein
MCDETDNIRAPTTQRTMKLLILVVTGALGGGAPSATPAETPIPVRATGTDEFFPSADGTSLAWTQDAPRGISRPTVYAHLRGSRPVRVNPKGTTAFAVGISGRQVVYRQLRPLIQGRSPFKIYNLRTRRRAVVRLNPQVGFQGFEAKPSFGGGLLRYSWNTHTDVEGILLLSLSSGRDKLIDRVAFDGYVAVGQVNRNFAVWQKCVRNDCGVNVYGIARRTRAKVPNPARSERCLGPP